MAPAPTTLRAPVAPPATPSPTRIFLPIVLAIALLAALLPAHGALPVVALVRRTTIITTAATGIPSALCSIALHYTGRKAELGNLCVPLGLASGAVAASVVLLPELPLRA